MFFIKKSSKLIFITVVIIFLLFFLHYIKVLRPVENVFVSITKPALEYTYELSNKIGKNYLLFRSKKDLINENEELKVELSKLLQEKSTFLQEREENNFLREQLEFFKENDYGFEIANVIGQSVDNIQNSLILNKGEKHGVEIGYPVTTDEGVLIGKIKKVNKNSSIVILLNDDLSKVAVKIQNTNQTMGVIEGEFGLGMKMNLIPQNEEIKSGDIVITSGIENYIPSGLIVGLIKDVEKEPEELFQSASIRSLVDFNKITLVTILNQKNVD